MKHAVTHVDATEQNRKNRGVCSFCINERRSCDVKIMEVHRVRGCSGNGMNLHAETRSCEASYEPLTAEERLPQLHPSVCKARHVTFRVTKYYPYTTPIHHLTPI